MRFTAALLWAAPWTREPLSSSMTCKTGSLLSFTWSHCYRRHYRDSVKDTNSVTLCVFIKRALHFVLDKDLKNIFQIYSWSVSPAASIFLVSTQQWYMALAMIQGGEGVCHASSHLSDEHRVARRTSSKWFGAVLNFLSQEHQMASFTEKVFILWSALKLHVEGNLPSSLTMNNAAQHRKC